MTDSTGIASVDAAVVWCVALAAIGGAIAGVWRALRPLREFARRAELFWDDWAGSAERPGVPARPGVMQRLERIERCVVVYDERMSRVEHELHPNSGSSLRDAVNRIETAVRPDYGDQESRLAPA